MYNRYELLDEIVGVRKMTGDVTGLGYKKETATMKTNFPRK
ncbi:hypothetical protein A2U01_0074450, partial [Trifolium medium]|nr:hypothetical protein [Trifolium medium]